MKRIPTPRTYVKRSGTSNVGQMFETKLLTMVLFRLLHYAHFYSFFLGANLDDAGAFDDLVLRGYAGGKVQVYCLQAKHKKPGSVVNVEAVAKKKEQKDFLLEKYFESFLAIRYTFGATSDHTIFRGTYEQTELELIIFTTTDFVFPDGVQRVNSNKRDLFNTKDSGIAFQIECTSDFEQSFLDISRKWHKNKIADMLTKKQLLNNGKVEQLNPQQKMQDQDNQNEILQEFFMPSKEHHSQIVQDFFSKLVFYTQQATENELDEIIKRDVKKKYKNEDSIFLHSHQAVESWWKQTGEVEFLTETCTIFEQVVHQIEIEKNQAISMESIKPYFAKFSQHSLNFGKQFSKEQLFMHIYSNTPQLTCAKIIQRIQLLDIDFKFVIIGKSFLLETLQVFSKFNTQFMIIAYLPECDGGRIETIRKNVQKLIVVTCEIHAGDWESIKDETRLIDLELTFQDKLFQSEITFQGIKLSLNKLLTKAKFEELAGAVTLQKLINDEKLVISNSIFSTENDNSAERYYIDRTLLDNQRKSQLLKSILDKSEKIFIIAANAGMGKSTLLTRLAKEIKESNPSHWVVRINLLTYSEQFYQWINKDLNKNDALNFLMKATGNENDDSLESFERQIFLWYCEQLNVYLLIDGFDEISPDYTNIVLKLLQLYKHNFAKKVCVTTRSGAVQKTLEDNLGISAYTLQPFTAEETKRFLFKFFKTKLDLSSDQEEMVENFVNQLFFHLSQSIDYEELDLMRVPLQIKMIGMIFQDDFEKYCISKDSQLKLEKVDVVILYKKFIHLKFNVILIKDKHNFNTTDPFIRHNVEIMFKRFQKNHKQAAIYGLFNQHDMAKLLTVEEIDAMLNFLQEVQDSKEQTGIITRVVGKKPIFVHQTYAEFFAALFIWEKYVSLQGEELESFIENILIKRLIREDRHQIAKFLQLIAKKEISNQSEDINSKACVLLEGLVTNSPDSWNEFKQRSFPCLLGIVEYSTSSMNNNEKILACINGTTECVQDVLLLKASESGYIRLVRMLFEEGSARVNATFDWLEGRTALYLASGNGHLEIVKFLIEKRADVKITTKKHGLTALHIATRNSARSSNSPEIVRLLVESGAGIDCTTTDGRTPLYEASCHVAVNAVKTLLSMGANANLSETKEGYTPLHKAAMKRYDSEAAKKDALEIVRLLLDHGASYLPIGSGLNPLHAAATGGNRDILELLLEQDAKNTDVNVQCRALWRDFEVTSLFMACTCGNLETVQLLLSKGANVHLGIQHLAFMPIHMAARQNCTEILKLLVANGALINCTTSNNGRTPLYVAASFGAKNALQFLLESGANIELGHTVEGWTPLHRAARNGYLEIVEILLNHGANIGPTTSGYTALHAVATGGSSEVLEFLLEKGIDIDSKWKDEEITPLLQACAKGHLNIIKHLIDRGADVNLGIKPTGYMPLHWAARNDWTDIIRLLISKGAEINCPTTTDICRTPLYEAASNGAKNAAKLLLQLGANPLMSGENPLHIAANKDNLEITRILLNYGADSLPTEHGSTPPLTTVSNGVRIPSDIENIIRTKSAQICLMSHACDNGNLNIVKLLLAGGADVNLDTSTNGYTPIHRAARNDSVEIVKLLAAKGADKNCTTTDDRRTPLYEAAKFGAKKAVKLLLEMGADAELSNTNEGLTPLQSAASEGYIGVVRIILNHAATQIEMYDASEQFCQE